MVNFSYSSENTSNIKLAKKSNEITAILELLRILELSGCIITCDAMGCQKNIAKEIKEADADYILSLKGDYSGSLGHRLRET